MSEDISTETFFRRSRTAQNLNGSHKPKIPLTKRAILITLGILILVSLVIFAGLASKNNGENETIESQPTPTEAPTPTEEPTPTLAELTPTPKTSPSLSPKTSPSPTPKTSVTPTKSTSPTSTGLDRASLTIEIQNGSGVAGAATKVSDILKDLGYEISSTGNADNFDYENTVIQVKSTKKAYLDMLKKDLATDYTIGEATADLTGSSADALIIVGKN